MGCGGVSRWRWVGGEMCVWDGWRVYVCVCVEGVHREIDKLILPHLLNTYKSFLLQPCKSCILESGLSRHLYQQHNCKPVTTEYNHYNELPVKFPPKGAHN